MSEIQRDNMSEIQKMVEDSLTVEASKELRELIVKLEDKKPSVDELNAAYKAGYADGRASNKHLEDVTYIKNLQGSLLWQYEKLVSAADLLRKLKSFRSSVSFDDQTLLDELIDEFGSKIIAGENDA